MLSEFAHLRKAFWGRHLRARGYFCCSSGNVTDEVITAYIEGQREEEDAEFRVEGEAGSRRGPPKPSA
jgi:putative transposase